VRTYRRRVFVKRGVQIFISAVNRRIICFMIDAVTLMVFPATVVYICLCVLSVLLWILQLHLFVFICLNLHNSCTNKHVFQTRINFIRFAVSCRQFMSKKWHHVHEDVYTAMQMKQTLYLSKACATKFNTQKFFIMPTECLRVVFIVLAITIIFL